MLFFGLTGDALWQAFVMMGAIGFGVGFTFAAMPGLIVGAVPLHETSSAMSFFQVTRYVGFSIGSGLRGHAGAGVRRRRRCDGGRIPFDVPCRRRVSARRRRCLPGCCLGGPTFARPGGGDPELDTLDLEEAELAAAGLQR